MQKAVNFLGGTVSVEIICEYPERFLNICAGNDVEFWDFTQSKEGEIYVTVNIKGYRVLKNMAARGGFEIKLKKRQGVPFFLLKIRKRYALLAGMLLCFGALFVSSLFIWEIEVSGNENVPDSLILQNLDELGVGIGTCRFAYSQTQVSTEMLLRVPELCWITVNIHGSHADVLVREGIQAPDTVDEDTPTLVYSAKSGIITSIIVPRGKTLCAVGDTVLAGDILVTGAMDSIASGTRYVHAMGEIYARTWYTLSAKTPLTVSKKVYTGEEKTKNALIIAGKRINLYFTGGNQWYNYDKIIDENVLTVLGGTVLPIASVSETYKEYEIIPTALEQNSAQAALERFLTDRLKEKIDGGEITSAEFEMQTSGDVMTVTMNAECMEQIAAVRNMTDTETTEYTESSDNTEETN